MKKKVNRNKLKLHTSKLRELASEDDIVFFKEDIIELEGETVPKNREVMYKSGFEIYSFLENENLRLEKLDHFLTWKIENIFANPQTETLYNNQLKENSQKLKKLIKTLKSPHSPLQKKLKTIWNSKFKR